MKKTIIAHFFTTINFWMVYRMFLFIVNPYNFFRLKNWKWIEKIEKLLLEYLWLKNSKIISFYNARSALFHSLNMIWIKKDDEIIIQAYTCVSVVNSVIQSQAKPIFVDIDETLNIDIQDLKQKITPKTKAIIVQHTFWNPADIEKIKKICDEKNIVLIEDCAHSLWAQYNSKKVGTFWDFAIFSFWRDKVISTVNWWFLVVNNQKYFDKIDEIKSNLIHKSNKVILQNIIYIFVSYKAKIFYDFFSLWKVIIFVSRKLHLIPEVLEASEKACLNKDFYSLYPNALAYLWYYELKKVDFYNEKRIYWAFKYIKELWEEFFPKTLTNSKNTYLRLVYFNKNREELKSSFKQNNILLWDWYDRVIAPAWTILENTYYKNWSCPNAEKYASLTINLPNHPQIKEKDFKKIIWQIKKF